MGVTYEGNEARMIRWTTNLPLILAAVAALQTLSLAQTSTHTLPVTFTDLPAAGGDRVAITSMVGQGIMRPVTPTRFDPDGLITREDFAVALTKMFRLSPPEKPIKFPDVPVDSAPFVEAAAPYMNRQILCFGCALGRNFLPAESVSDAETTISLTSVLVDEKKIELVSRDKAIEQMARVEGGGDLPPAAKLYFATAIRSGIVSGETSIQLKRKMTRADVAVQLYNVQQRFKFPQLQGP